ncbi:MAG: response regulator transcription factor [Rickettsiales bacterium]
MDKGKPDVASFALPPHLLAVDDDDGLRELLAEYLRREGYVVGMARSADEATNYLAFYRVDLILLDENMPKEKGTDFLRRLRKGEGVPVIMLTANNETHDRIAGLEAGADDYVAKPFAPKELSLRIARLLERSASPRHANDASDAHYVEIGRYRFTPATNALALDGNDVALGERDRTLLALLAESGGAPVAREELARRCGINERSVDVGVARLRAKLEPDPKKPILLQTVRGAGYVLRQRMR